MMYTCLQDYMDPLQVADQLNGSAREEIQARSHTAADQACTKNVPQVPHVCRLRRRPPHVMHDTLGSMSLSATADVERPSPAVPHAPSGCIAFLFLVRSVLAADT